MHEHGPVQLLAPPQHRRCGFERRRIADEGGGDLEPDQGRVVEQRLQAVEVRVDRRDRRPPCERRAEVADAVVPGVQKHSGLDRRKVLDAQRGGRCEHDPADAGVDSCAGRRVVVARIDGVRRLVCGVQHPATKHRGLATGTKRVQEGGRPQVLMHVDR